MAISPDWERRWYLVVKCEEPVPAYTSMLYPCAFVGLVRARDGDEACRIAMSEAGDITRYAAVPADSLDFDTGEHDLLGMVAAMPHR